MTLLLVCSLLFAMPFTQDPDRLEPFAAASVAAVSEADLAAICREAVRLEIARRPPTGGDMRIADPGVGAAWAPELQDVELTVLTGTDVRAMLARHEALYYFRGFTLGRGYVEATLVLGDADHAEGVVYRFTRCNGGWEGAATGERLTLVGSGTCPLQKAAPAN